jgi:hypothetical protein
MAEKPQKTVGVYEKPRSSPATRLLGIAVIAIAAAVLIWWLIA